MILLVRATYKTFVNIIRTKNINNKNTSVAGIYKIYSENISYNILKEVGDIKENVTMNTKRNL